MATVTARQTYLDSSIALITSTSTIKPTNASVVYCLARVAYTMCTGETMAITAPRRAAGRLTASQRTSPKATGARATPARNGIAWAAHDARPNMPKSRTSRVVNPGVVANVAASSLSVSARTPVTTHASSSHRLPGLSPDFRIHTEPISSSTPSATSAG